MADLDFDPSGVALKNGSFFGLDCSAEQSEILIQSLPWDVTTSYRPGTRLGPQAILEASYQVDFYTPFLNDAWKMKIATLAFPKDLLNHSQQARTQSEKYIGFLESGGDLSSSPAMQEILMSNRKLQKISYEQTKKWLSQGKKIMTVGGDHSVSFGPIQAYSEKFSDLSVLHFDAHADLRNAYEGFEHSHASIMFNVMKLKNIQKLVQVGIRDVSPTEIEFIGSDDRIKTYFDWDLKEAAFNGRNWHQVCDEMISQLSQNVYISFDIDGLDPKLCPNTGTPVAGGLEFAQATYLIQSVRRSGRKIVGADLVEVAPGPDGDQWDGNVGARLLFQLCIAMSELK